MTHQKEQNDAEKLATLRAELQAGRDEMKAGLWVDAADMFAEFDAEDTTEEHQRNNV